MSIVLELEQELEDQLRARAARQGRRTEVVARELLADALRWEKEDSEQAVAGVKRGLSEVAAGRERPLR